MRYAVVALCLAAATANADEWHSFFDAAAFGSYVTETGPKKPQSRLFSTNWMIAGAERQFGGVTILGRARLSLEPLTIPKGGYPQLLQYISPESGGPLVDHMRAHDLVEEAAFGVEWKPIQLYLAPVGDAPIGPEPFAQRWSSRDFAEAPFSYDVQESFHHATRVAAAAFTSKFADVEYGVFHESVSTGQHSNIEDGNIDSWGARLTLAPESKLSAQISTGRLGDAKRKVTSGSVSYRGPVLAATGMWTKLDSRTAYGLETTIRYWRSTIMARGEVTDRPAGVFSVSPQRRTDLTVGYIFDFLLRKRQRAGVGIDIDYHSNTRALEGIYGHKPQSVYTFVRWRTDGASIRS
jgi:hypothetical protein